MWRSWYFTPETLCKPSLVTQECSLRLGKGAQHQQTTMVRGRQLEPGKNAEPELTHTESFYVVYCTLCMLLAAGLHVACLQSRTLHVACCEVNKCPRLRWNGISLHSELAYMFFRRRCLETPESFEPDWMPETGLAPLTSPSICPAICTYEQAE